MQGQRRIYYARPTSNRANKRRRLKRTCHQMGRHRARAKAVRRTGGNPSNPRQGRIGLHRALCQRRRRFKSRPWHLYRGTLKPVIQKRLSYPSTPPTREDSNPSETEVVRPVVRPLEGWRQRAAEMTKTGFNAIILWDNEYPATPPAGATIVKCNDVPQPGWVCKEWYSQYNRTECVAVKFAVSIKIYKKSEVTLVETRLSRACS